MNQSIILASCLHHQCHLVTFPPVGHDVPGGVTLNGILSEPFIHDAISERSSSLTGSSSMLSSPRTSFGGVTATDGGLRGTPDGSSGGAAGGKQSPSSSGANAAAPDAAAALGVGMSFDDGLGPSIGRFGFQVYFSNKCIIYTYI